MSETTEQDRQDEVRQQLKKMLSFDDIVSADDIKTEDVEVPEWGGFITVKVFSKREQQDIRRAMMSSRSGDQADYDNFERMVVLTGLVTPSISADQYNLMLERSGNAFDTVLKAILTVNNMSEDSTEEAEAQFPG